MLEKGVQQRRQDIKQGKPRWATGLLQGLEESLEEQGSVLGVEKAPPPVEMAVWGVLEQNPGTMADSGWISTYNQKPQGTT